MGDDDFMDEDRSIVMTPAGAAVLPQSLRNLKGDALEEFVVLQHLATQIQALEEQMWAEIPLARDLGLSWAAIGAAIGMTGEGVAKRARQEGESS